MLRGHFHSAGASVPFGDASDLFPLEDLDGRVLRHREAELALESADSESVVVVAPTSLATSYHLGDEGLAAIHIETLPAEIRAKLDAALDAPLSRFDLIQVGRWHSDSPNHSLTEFGDA